MDVLLVTGGAGFIGSALVRALLAGGHTRVVNLDALTYAANPESLAGVADHPLYAFERVDVRDGAAVRSVLDEHRPTGVVHLAAETHVDRSIDGPAAFVSTNVTGTLTLLEEALRYWRGMDAPGRERFRFVHASTDEVFGSASRGRFREDSPYRPRSPYSASKAGADHLVRAWHHTFGLPTVVTHASNSYGPWQFPEKLVPLAIAKALRGEPIPVYGTGGNVRDWLHVDDHARALLAVVRAAAAGDSYCVGAGEEHRNLEVVRTLCRHLDDLAPDRAGPRERLIRLVEDRPGHDLRYAVDPSSLREDLGWTPRVDFETGLRATVEWYLEHRGWLDRVLTGAYRGERLGTPVRVP
jgi:dTDP-glucose 4,6-dehydratase